MCSRVGALPKIISSRIFASSCSRSASRDFGGTSRSVPGTASSNFAQARAKKTVLCFATARSRSDRFETSCWNGKRLTHCSRPTVLFERWRQHYHTIRPHNCSGDRPHNASGYRPHNASGYRPHNASGYRTPAPKAWQPRSFAWSTPQQTHGAGLLEGKTLT
jgi:hypothetical protein